MNTPEVIRAGMDAVESARYATTSLPRGPWVFQRDGRDMVACSDGQILVATTRESVSGEFVPVPDPVINLVRQIEPSGVEPVSSSRLAEFIARETAPAICASCNNTRTIECDECNGDGEAECSRCGHDSECDGCDGDGTVPCQDCAPKSRPARIGGLVVNRTLLAQALDVISPDDADVSWAVRHVRGTGKCLVVSGRDWFVVVMAMVNGTQTTVEFERPDTWESPAAAVK